MSADEFIEQSRREFQAKSGLAPIPAPNISRQPAMAIRGLMEMTDLQVWERYETLEGWLVHSYVQLGEATDRARLAEENTKRTLRHLVANSDAPSNVAAKAKAENSAEYKHAQDEELHARAMASQWRSYIDAMSEALKMVNKQLTWRMEMAPASARAAKGST